MAREICDLESFLVSAVRQSDVEEARACIDRYCLSPNIHDEKGQPLLFLAVRNQCVAMVELLIDKGAIIDPVSKNPIHSPLFQALLSRNEKMIKALIGKGADINARYVKNETILMALAISGAPAACLPLAVEHGAELNARSDAGWNALTYALFNNVISDMKSSAHALADMGADLQMEFNLALLASVDGRQNTDEARDVLTILRERREEDDARKAVAAEARRQVDLARERDALRNGVAKMKIKRPRFGS